MTFSKNYYLQIILKNNTENHLQYKNKLSSSCEKEKIE